MCCTQVPIVTLTSTNATHLIVPLIQRVRTQMVATSVLAMTDSLRTLLASAKVSRTFTIAYYYQYVIKNFLKYLLESFPEGLA